MQIDANKYIRLDKDGLDLQNVSIIPEYSQTVAGDNYIISDKSDTGSMEVFIGDPYSQYFYGNNKSIQISSSNFFLSSSGQLFISGGGGSGVSIHNLLSSIQGGNASSQYYHLSYNQYFGLLTILGQTPPVLPMFSYFYIGNQDITSSYQIYLQQRQNLGPTASFA